MTLTHADNSSLVVHLNTLTLKGMPTSTDNLSDLRIKRIGKPNMANDALLEESEGSDALGSIDNLVWNNEVPRSDLFLQRAYGREGDDGSHTDLAKRSNVGARWDLMWSVFVMSSMSGEESDRGTVVLED